VTNCVVLSARRRLRRSLVGKKAKVGTKRKDIDDYLKLFINAHRLPRNTRCRVYTRTPFFVTTVGISFTTLVLLLTCFSVELNAPKDCCARCKVVPPPICCDLCHPDAVSRFVPGLTAIINPPKATRKPKQIKVTPYESSMAEQSLKNELLTWRERTARNLFGNIDDFTPMFFYIRRSWIVFSILPMLTKSVSSRSQESNLVVLRRRIWWRHYHARQAALSPNSTWASFSAISLCVDPPALSP